MMASLAFDEETPVPAKRKRRREPQLVSTRVKHALMSFFLPALTRFREESNRDVPLHINRDVCSPAITADQERLSRVLQVPVDKYSQHVMDFTAFVAAIHKGVEDGIIGPPESMEIIQPETLKLWLLEFVYTIRSIGCLYAQTLKATDLLNNEGKVHVFLFWRCLYDRMQRTQRGTVLRHKKRRRPNKASERAEPPELDEAQVDEGDDFESGGESPPPETSAVPVTQLTFGPNATASIVSPEQTTDIARAGAIPPDTPPNVADGVMLTSVAASITSDASLATPVASAFSHGYVGPSDDAGAYTPMAPVPLTIVRRPRRGGGGSGVSAGKRKQPDVVFPSQVGTSSGGSNLFTLPRFAPNLHHQPATPPQPMLQSPLQSIQPLQSLQSLHTMQPTLQSTSPSSYPLPNMMVPTYATVQMPAVTTSVMTPSLVGASSVSVGGVPTATSAFLPTVTSPPASLDLLTSPEATAVLAALLPFLGTQVPGTAPQPQAVVAGGLATVSPHLASVMPRTVAGGLAVASPFVQTAHPPLFASLHVSTPPQPSAFPLPAVTDDSDHARAVLAMMIPPDAGFRAADVAAAAQELANADEGDLKPMAAGESALLCETLAGVLQESGAVLQSPDLAASLSSSVSGGDSLAAPLMSLDAAAKARVATLISTLASVAAAPGSSTPDAILVRTLLALQHQRAVPTHGTGAPPAAALGPPVVEMLRIPRPEHGTYGVGGPNKTHSSPIKFSSGVFRAATSPATPATPDTAGLPTSIPMTSISSLVATQYSSVEEQSPDVLYKPFKPVGGAAQTQSASRRRAA